jgi:hypothetical protein
MPRLAIPTGGAGMVKPASTFNTLATLVPQVANNAVAAATAAPVARATGGGGGGGAQVAAAPAIAKPSLSDYINSNFLYQQQQGVNDDALAGYDQQTLKGQQDTEAEQALRTQQLNQNLAAAGNTNAEDLAAHGLLRSGVNFQNQDKIDAQGVNQKSAIDSLLTQFNDTRQSGRLTQQQANAQALNSVIQQLTQQFNTQNQATI